MSLSLQSVWKRHKHLNNNLNLSTKASEIDCIPSFKTSIIWLACPQSLVLTQRFGWGLESIIELIKYELDKFFAKHCFVYTKSKVKVKCQLLRILSIGTKLFKYLERRRFSIRLFYFLIFVCMLRDYTNYIIIKIIIIILLINYALILIIILSLIFKLYRSVHNFFWQVIEHRSYNPGSYLFRCNRQKICSFTFIKSV